MTLKVLYESISQNLSDAQKQDLFWLLLEVFNISNSDYYLKGLEEVNNYDSKKYLRLANKYLKKQIPVQQLVGYSYFYGKKFYVSKHTLIPRKETEILIEEVIKEIKLKFKDFSNLKILDLGTGTGIIGIMLSEELGANVTISDISKKALKVARKNIILHQVNVNVVNSNWFSNINDKFDVIISNPPYIKASEDLDEIVLKEPKKALYSGIDGLNSYRNILKDIKHYLNNKYIVAFEHSYNQSEKIITLTNEHLSNVNIKVIKDYQNIERHLIVSGELNEK